MWHESKAVFQDVSDENLLFHLIQMISKLDKEQYSGDSTLHLSLILLVLTHSMGNLVKRKQILTIELVELLVTVAQKLVKFIIWMMVQKYPLSTLEAKENRTIRRTSSFW